MTDGLSRTTAYTYDNLGRQARFTPPDPDGRSPISIATVGRGLLEENLGGSFEAKTGARAVIEAFFHVAHLLVRDVAKISSLGKILTDQIIGVYAWPYAKHDEVDWARVQRMGNPLVAGVSFKIIVCSHISKADPDVKHDSRIRFSRATC